MRVVWCEFESESGRWKSTCRYIDYRFEALSKKIKSEHIEYKSRQMLKKKYQAQKAALDFFLKDKYAQYSKSRKQAYKVLREETALPKFILKNAIQMAYIALFDSSRNMLTILV